MKYLKQLMLLAAVFAATTACSADQPPSADEEGIYEYKSASRDGIGKFYMGREISHVMGHRGAGWLERPERERQERTDLLITRLPISPGDKVADIGAGTGFFSFPIAKRVPEGRVYAVDIQPEMLAMLEERKNAMKLANVESVLGSETSPNLPSGAIDLAFIVDAYHEFSYPREMGLALFDALRAGGKLVLIEYRSEDPSVPIKTLHKMSEDQARREMAAIGLEWVRTEDYLPQQHVLIFEKPMADNTNS
ncbi:class I SAM-dependent methyltransferase [Congregibacter litoralis]|uniref:Methylase involved in ubiquinone/menaquinone biosynthesis n=1 Tax=Congregibacter litoralis KT71 TaxID=314285 RepID=A4A6W8_9GAMM|nr:methyltransferase domain-containing protein [Congregibacter litoralis]EAQ98037.2 Methylase involved in ubiquinone/menaquinone biosynthesis [Congregibacter litoralis KT71]